MYLLQQKLPYKHKTLQSTLNKAIETILGACSDVELWNYYQLHYDLLLKEAEAAKKIGEDVKTNIKPPKPMHKQVRLVETKKY